MAEHKKVPEGEEKKSSKKLIIIIIAAVVLLAGGGGAGYWWFFMRGHDAKDVKEGKENKEDHGEKAESDDDEHAEVEKIYYDFGKPLVVNFTKSTSGRLVSISLSFLVEDPKTIDVLKKNEPMIRNNLLMLINAQGIENLISREGKDKLRAAILTDVSEVVKKMAGKSHIKDVYFTSFVMQ